MQFAKQSGVVTWSQGTAILRTGQSIDDDHPLLAERPDLFTEDDPGPGRGDSHAEGPDDDAAPG
jgi:hypothetical protein